MVTRCNCPPKAMTSLPWTQLALSFHAQVCVLRPCGSKSGVGGVVAKPPRRYPGLEKFCVVAKVAGAKSNPNLASLVMFPPGFQRHAMERNFVVSLLLTTGTLLKEVSMSGRSTICRFHWKVAEIVLWRFNS